MVNDVKDAISIKLNQIYGDYYEIYSKDVKQGLNPPCFFIKILNPSQRQLIGNRYYLKISVDVHYFPAIKGDNAEQNAALTPYRMQEILGNTNYRNIGIGQSGYWNASTGRRSALLDQSKEYQELKNMEFAGRLTSAQEAQILLDSEAQQVLNKYLDQQQQADLFIKGQTLANLFAQGALTEAQYHNQMAQAVKTAVETNGLRI